MFHLYVILTEPFDIFHRLSYELVKFDSIVPHFRSGLRIITLTCDMRQCPNLTSCEELSLACLYLGFLAVIAFHSPS